MQFDGTLGDGKPDPASAIVRFTSICNPEERPNQIAQQSLRYSRTLIKNRHHCATTLFITPFTNTNLNNSEFKYSLSSSQSSAAASIMSFGSTHSLYYLGWVFFDLVTSSSRLYRASKASLYPRFITRADSRCCAAILLEPTSM
jgi:hypothetical protein